MKRSLTFLLALLIACAGASSCGGSTAGPAETTDTTANADVTDTQEADYKSNFPSGLDFGGQTVRIFGWEGTSGAEFTVEAQDGEIVNDAIYNRNTLVSEYLNVELEFTLAPGNYANRSEWLTTVRGTILSGEGDIDIIGGYSQNTATLAVEHLLIDLNPLPYLNFDEPWWSQSIAQESSVGGKLYFASGDISNNLTHSMYCTFFNKDLIDAYQLENPYELVRSGKWTVDKMHEMTKNTYVDVNNDGTKDYGDNYGLITRVVTNDSFFYAAGFRSTTIGSDGFPQLAYDSQGEQIHALLSKLVEYFSDNHWLKVPDDDLDQMNAIFMENRAVFLNSEALFASTDLRYSDVDYGVLPIPKGSEDVEEYQTCTKHTYTLYGIPIDAKSPDASAAVLECFAIEGHYNVSPALFETALKVKYVSDDDASEMYDIIRSNLVFEFGRIYQSSLSSLTQSMFRNSLRDDNSNWFSKYDSSKEKLERLFGELIETLTASEES